MSISFMASSYEVSFKKTSIIVKWLWDGIYFLIVTNYFCTGVDFFGHFSPCLDWLMFLMYLVLGDFLVILSNLYTQRYNRLK